MPHSYIGELDVSPDDFTLQAERFIVSERSISFRLEAQDEDGRYWMEGQAHKNSSGVFISPSLHVKYQRASGEFEASVKFSLVAEDAGSCAVKGVWLQDGDEWQFGGTLKQYAA